MQLHTASPALLLSTLERAPAWRERSGSLWARHAGALGPAAALLPLSARWLTFEPPLTPTLRARLEPRLEGDLGSVQLHTASPALLLSTLERTLARRERSDSLGVQPAGALEPAAALRPLSARRLASGTPLTPTLHTRLEPGLGLISAVCGCHRRPRAPVVYPGADAGTARAL